MTPEQAQLVVDDLATIKLLLIDTNDWLSQIMTYIYWANHVLLPLIGACMVLWWVLKRYMY